MLNMQALEVEPSELQRRLGDTAKLVVLDVRQPEELLVATIEPLVTASGVHELKSIPLMELPDRLDELTTYRDEETPIVVLCRVGERSRMATEFLSELGFTRVANLRGGIRAFARECDGTIPQY